MGNIEAKEEEKIMGKKKKRMPQKEFDLVYNALFEGIKHPKVKYNQHPEKWRR